LWRAEFRRGQIGGVRRLLATDTAVGKTVGYLSLVVFNEPQWLIGLKEPVMICGPFGRRQAATRIGVAVDDSDAFGAALGDSGGG